MKRCDFCRMNNRRVSETRAGDLICEECFDKHGFCEICGSVKEENQSADDQLHYEEECFK